MRIWLTLDCCSSYLVDGVAGCYVWVSEPVKDEAGRWVSATADCCFRKIGKRILNHKEIERLDNEIMLHFVPDMNLEWARADRFDRVSKAMWDGYILGDSTFKTTLDVTPEEWFDWAFKVAEHYTFEAAHAQKVFDLPF